MFFSALRTFRLKSVLLTVCFSCLSFVLVAGERPDTTRVYEIGELTVTEQYSNTEVRSSSPLQILTSRNLEKLNVLQVSDAIKYFSGVSVKDYGGIGGLKTISVRSLGAGHTAVSYDGVALTDCQTGQIDIGRFSLENVDMLSLSNGQSDNIFLPARLFASASLLNIRTQTPVFTDDKKLKAKVSFKTGSFGLFNPSFILQSKTGKKMSTSLNGEWLSSNGAYPYILEYSSGTDALKSKERRLNSDVRNLRLEGNIYYTFSEKESVSLKAFFYNSERGLPGATIFYNQNAFASQRMNDYTFFAQTHYQKDFSANLKFQFNAKYHHAFTHYTDTIVHNSAGYEENKHHQNEFYSSASLLYRAFDNLSFSASTDGFVNNLYSRFENESLTNSFPNPVRLNFLTSLAAKYANEHVLATGSVLSTMVNDLTETDGLYKKYNRLSPYLSFTYKPLTRTDLRFRAFYKNIFRLPTFNDMYYGRITKSDLKPEKTNQLNAGLTFASKRTAFLPDFSVTADVFKNSVQDKIVVIPAKNLYYWSVTNLGEVSVTGFDLNFETAVNLTETTGIQFSATYNYQKAIDVTDPDNSTYGHQIPYTPRISGSAVIMLETGFGDLSYSMLWSGARYAGFQNYSENRLPGYSDHNVSYSKNFKIKDCILNFKTEMLNVFNENYAVIRYYPMPGRSFRVSLNIKY